MQIGIDGNCWYCSNGRCLGDPRAEFTFQRTLRAAVDEYREKFSPRATLPGDMLVALDMTPEQYLKAMSEGEGEDDE